MIVLLLIYLMLCAWAANWAAKRGRRDFWTVFFISIAISPLAVIGLLCTPFNANKSSLLKE